MADDEYEFGPDGLPVRVTAKDKRRRTELQAKSVEVDDTQLRRTPAMGVQRKVEKRQTKRTMTASESELPGGGSVHLVNPQEAAYFEKMKSRYVDEYQLTKPNDLQRLGQLLVFELLAYRLTGKMLGQTPKYSDQGVFEGYLPYDPEEVYAAQEQLPKIQDEIRKLENQLRLDKKSRDGAGGNDTKDYMIALKEAATQYGIHLSERYTRYDEFANELRWRLRVLDDADEADRAYHDISEESILKYVRNYLADMTEFDRAFAHDRQSLWVGKV